MRNDFKLTKEEQQVVDRQETNEEKNRVIDNLQRHKKWKLSLEGVCYQLGEIYLTDQMISAVVRTVHKLPDKVKDFVYENCKFSSPFGGGSALYVKSNHVVERPWLITLAENLTDESIIAHEIAHAFLDHKGGSELVEIEEAMKEETEVCSLAKQWGFSGSGTKVSKSLIEAKKRKER